MFGQWKCEIFEKIFSRGVFSLKMQKKWESME